MSGLGGSKPVIAPQVPDPIPVPEADVIGGQTADQARAKRFRRGRGRTFLTGNLEPETIGKKRLLG